MADHFSRLEEEAILKVADGVEIYSTVPDEQVFVASFAFIPRFANFANYLASDVVPSNLTFYRRRKFMSDLKKM